MAIQSSSAAPCEVQRADNKRPPQALQAMAIQSSTAVLGTAVFTKEGGACQLSHQELPQPEKNEDKKRMSIIERHNRTNQGRSHEHRAVHQPLHARHPVHQSTVQAHEEGRACESTMFVESDSTTDIAHGILSMQRIEI